MFIVYFFLALHMDTTTPDIWEHSRNVENTRLRLMFFTFPLCSQMPAVFYHRIHGFKASLFVN